MQMCVCVWVGQCLGLCLGRNCNISGGPTFAGRCCLSAAVCLRLSGAGPNPKKHQKASLAKCSWYQSFTNLLLGARRVERLEVYANISMLP